MIELILGIGIGAMAFTAKGREAGNAIGNFAIDYAKKILKNEKSTEQSTGAVGDNSNCS
jgi:hypothetical protein